MIKNMWYGVLLSKEVPINKPVSFKRLNQELVFWRDSTGKVACINNQCCHRGASLSLGKVQGDHVSCPFHGFEYDRTGLVNFIPANGKIDTVQAHYHNHAYPVKEQSGFIFIFNGPQELSKSIPLPSFAELDSFNVSYHQEVWPVHYTRAAENQLDVCHVPFVHHNTIGRGMGTLVDGPVVVEDDYGFSFYVHNVNDDGTRRGLKPHEVENYESFFKLSFKMPNMWQNHISDIMRISACFAPIDDTHTMIYLGYHHKISSLPIIKELINVSGMFFSKIVLHQDRRIVITQPPNSTNMNNSDKLIPGDSPIITFRKLNAMNSR